MENLIKIFITTVLVSFLLVSCDENKNASKAKTVDKTSITPQNGSLVSDKDYETFSIPYDTQNKEKVVVYEFFGYTCPHCYTFEPYINKWLETKPDYVEFIRVPLNFQPAWANYQQAYLTAEAMGIAEQSHLKLFEALHKDNKRFNTMDEIATWYADEFDIDKAVFLSTADSFILDSKLRKADNMGFKMQVTSTPTLIINGKHRAAKAILNNRNKIMQVLDFLVEKEAKSMGFIE